MKKFSIALLAVLSLSTIASAAVLGCGAAGNLATNTFLCNGVTFDNLSAIEGSTGGGYTIAPGTNISASVDGVVNVVGGVATITFSLDASAIANQWNLAGAQQSAFDLFYTATSRVGPFSSVSNQQNSSRTGQGSNQITKDICTATCPPFGGNYLTSIVTTDATPFGSVGIPAQNILFIHENVQQAASSGTATLTSFSNTLGTPEPMSMGLMGFGLLAVGFFGRRFKK